MGVRRAVGLSAVVLFFLSEGKREVVDNIADGKAHGKFLRAGVAGEPQLAGSLLPWCEVDRFEGDVSDGSEIGAAAEGILRG